MPALELCSISSAAGGYLEAFPSILRRGDVGNVPCSYLGVWNPKLDAVPAHDGSGLERYLNDRMPNPIYHQSISNIVRVHNKEEDHILIHPLQRGSKDECEGQDD